MCGRRRARIAVLKTLLERLLGWLLARFLYGYVGRLDFFRAAPDGYTASTSRTMSLWFN